MSEENEGRKDDNDFRQFDNSASLVFSSIELSYL